MISFLTGLYSSMIYELVQDLIRSHVKLLCYPADICVACAFAYHPSQPEEKAWKCHFVSGRRPGTGDTGDTGDTWPPGRINLSLIVLLSCIHACWQCENTFWNISSLLCSEWKIFSRQIWKFYPDLINRWSALLWVFLNYLIQNGQRWKACGMPFSQLNWPL